MIPENAAEHLEARKMPAPKKDMKSFLNEFFNPPKFSKTNEEKGVGKKVIKKKVKKKTPVLSPLQVNKLDPN